MEIQTITIEVRPSTNVTFFDSYEMSTNVQRMVDLQVALYNSPGWKGQIQEMSEDRLTLEKRQLWESQEAFDAFVSANAALLSARHQAYMNYCQSVGSQLMLNTVELG